MFLHNEIHSMYQMYAYSKKYDTKDIWLLYPVNEEMRNHSQINFQSFSYMTGELETMVKVYFVDVANIEQSLGDLSDLITDDKKDGI